MCAFVTVAIGCFVVVVSQSAVVIFLGRVIRNRVSAAVSLVCCFDVALMMIHHI